jgi:hypothetical protein
MLDTSAKPVRLSIPMSGAPHFLTHFAVTASAGHGATLAIAGATLLASRLLDRKSVANAASINALTTEGASTDG